MEHKVKLLAPDFSSFTAESFYKHVESLKRAPERSAGKRPPKLQKLRGKLVARGKIFEIWCGKSMYPLSYSSQRVGRKLEKEVSTAGIHCASQALLQPVGAIVALLERKKFVIPQNISTVEMVQELLQSSPKGESKDVISTQGQEASGSA